MSHAHKWKPWRKPFKNDAYRCGFRYCMSTGIVVACFECREYRCAKHAPKSMRAGDTSAKLSNCGPAKRCDSVSDSGYRCSGIKGHDGDHHAIRETGVVFNDDVDGEKR